MNKKFLSAILFGALLATTTSTFVSCKDYDDDINGLQEQIDGLKTNLTSEASALRSELASAKTQLESDLKAVESDLTAAKTSLEAAIAAKADQTTVDALQTKVSTLETKASNLETRVSAIETTLDGIDSLIAELKVADAANATELNAIKADLAAYKKEVDSLFAKTLTSLVLNPELYYGGIEAVQVSTIEYNELTLKAVTADGDHKNDAATVANVKTQMSPIFSATYHMNPSSADLSGLTKDAFAFKFEDKKYVSRAAALTSETLKFETKDGDLTVSALLTGGLIADGDSENVTTVALEVTLEEGVTVTSDYAAVYAETITGFVLDNETEEGCDTEKGNPIYTTAAQAIRNNPIAKVAWNETIDLADYVETHYTTAKGCALLPETTLSAYGFSYVYELVGYTDGTNQTSQSAHAALDGSELRPQLPTSEGKAAAFGSTLQNQATIGRMPLVRVTLVDNNSKKNVAVGYVKVEIIATPGKNTIGALANYTFTAPFTLSCAQSLEPQSVKWFEIEDQILSQLGISKTEFDNNYKLDAEQKWVQDGYWYGQGHWEREVKFYTDNTLEAKETTVEGVTVVEGTDDETGTTTEVLKMTVAANKAYNHFLKNTSMSVVVRYSKLTGTDAFNKPVYDYVYVTLTWAPSPLNVNPVGTISNEENKIQKYWFADDNNEGGSGYNEIHVNVNVPGSENVTTENFLKNIMHTFKNNKIVISGVDAAYVDFQDEKLFKTLEFAATQSTTPLVGTDGKTYVISGEGNTLYATSGNVKKDIAILSKDGIITYQNNDVAKALLNAAGREELAKNVTATIVVKEQNKCEKQLIELTNNTFDVKFLRPISVAQAEMESFKDGVDVGAEGSKVALKLNFTDWRNYAFEDSYYKHYGVQKITADIKGATTNVSGEWASLPTGMTISYNDGLPFTAIKNGNYGTIKYVNNNAEVGNFSIKVPFTVTYIWGTINLVVEFQVAKTV